MKKTLFIIASLLMTAYCVADDVVVGNHAKRDKNLQEKAVDPGNGYQFQQGDTIIISKDMKQYLTGEEPSEWVYYVRHIVGQVGGKRFPNGILVQGINSWVGPDGLLLVGATEHSAAADQRTRNDRAKVDQRREELRQMDKDRRKAIENDAKREGMTMLERDRKPAERELQEETRPAVREEMREVTPAVVEQTPPTQETLTVDDAKPVVNDTTIERQIDRLSIGLRGGVASFLHNATPGVNGNWKPGFDVLLDIQYAHYWQKGLNPSFGILTGLSVGYARSSMTAQYLDSLKTTDGKINYNINADVRENDGQVLLEVPVMFSMITNKGLFFNVGPRFQLPVFNHFNQTITNDNVDATFSAYDVTVNNATFTGKVDDFRNLPGKRQNMSKFNILLGAELGYEWRFQNNNALGLGVYASYGLFSLYDNAANGNLINMITEPSTSGPAKLDVSNATTVFTQGTGFKFGANNGLDFFDCGIKLNYSFNFVRQ